MFRARSICSFALAALCAAGCSSASPPADDASGATEGAATRAGFTFDRKLNLAASPPVDLTAGDYAAASGSFDPAYYAGATFSAEQGDEIDFGSSTWGSYLGIWKTSTALFQWAGGDACAATVTDGACNVDDPKNWTLIYRNNDSALAPYTASKTTRYMALILTTPSAYDFRASYWLYAVKRGSEPAVPMADIRGKVVCGSDNKTPVAGAHVLIDGEEGRTGADGMFTFAQQHASNAYTASIWTDDRPDPQYFPVIFLPKSMGQLFDIDCGDGGADPPNDPNN